jgi:choline dehydrogenase-like flavoprotein
MSTLTDPIVEGLARGWKVHGGPHSAPPAVVECDVAIVGTGAGAGITAEVLARAGLKVAMVEEGPLKSNRDFNQLESEAYPQLYQESAARKTADQAINILQGRCVGGSTTVNWTSSFRTPSATLAWWRDRYALPELTDDAMAPWFQQVEQRLSIGPWLVPPNVNNDLLALGAKRLGIPAAAILRNVKGCWNLGSCGLGCPTNAKQSMLITTVPAALDAGAVLLVETRAERVLLEGGRATGLQCVAVQANGAVRGDRPAVTVKARHIVVAGGAIHSPALLMRSGAPDPHGRLGQRTFLHPVVISISEFEQKVEGWHGAPQTIYTDHFLDTQPIDGAMGYKLEAPPLHPVIGSSTLSGFGADQAAAMARFPHMHAVLALLRDGFHPESSGGAVKLRGDGSPVLDYPLNDYVFDGARRALLSMAEIQFAAGAKSVQPVHELSPRFTRWADAKAALATLPMRPYATRVVSAHVMGGCAMAGKPELGVVRPDGRHWQLEGLSVHDGSVFPTSIGANPQLSVYGQAARMAAGLAERLGAKPQALA